MSFCSSRQDKERLTNECGVSLEVAFTNKFLTVSIVVSDLADAAHEQTDYVSDWCGDGRFKGEAVTHEDARRFSNQGPHLTRSGHFVEEFIA
ncbi:hypothetical protein DJ021_06370 [Phenylobacterium hankyongense]|uniref:Uncharacterized protein n=1 Tax=Phenylobacterium hankyongense TaxID=1813876 RepID=A0A328AYS9_9CAUL|nr:hypothetical protein DJ021_06370 [Phenylobacterium hankyongense]